MLFISDVKVSTASHLTSDLVETCNVDSMSILGSFLNAFPALSVLFISALRILLDMRSDELCD